MLQFEPPPRLIPGVELLDLLPQILPVSRCLCPHLLQHPAPPHVEQPLKYPRSHLEVHNDEESDGRHKGSGNDKGGPGVGVCDVGNGPERLGNEDVFASWSVTSLAVAAYGFLTHSAEG